MNSHSQLGSLGSAHVPDTLFHKIFVQIVGVESFFGRQWIVV